MNINRMTISELENESGVSRRTIHFYIREGVIPPPEGAGGAARYGEEHLLRLRLIQELQKSHLKLAGIREALDAITVKEMRKLVGTRGGEEATWDREALEHWLREGGASPKQEVVMSLQDSSRVLEDESFSFMAPFRKAPRQGGDQNGQRPQGNNLLKNLRRQTLVEGEPWTHYRPVDGIEVHIREDLLRQRRSEILSWMAELERLLNKE